MIMIPERTMNLEEKAALDALTKGIHPRASESQRISAVDALAKLICFLRPGLLKHDDWSNLILGLAEHAEIQNKSAAQKALQRLGYKHEKQWRSEQLKKGKKPGPRKMASTNATLEELDRLLSNARAMLKMPKGQVSSLGMLSQIAAILAADQTLRGACWLISHQQRGRLMWLANRGKSRDQPEERAMGEALESVDLEPLEEVSRISGLLHGQQIETLVPPHGDFPTPKHVPPDENSLYTAMAECLGLDVRVRFLSRPLQAGASAKSARIKTKAKPSLKEWKLDRGKILRTAVARLRELTALISEKQWCLLHEGLPEVVTRCLRCHSDYMMETSFLIEVQDFFTEIGNRQGIHPLSSASIERFVIQNPVKDWESTAGGKFGLDSA